MKGTYAYLFRKTGRSKPAWIVDLAPFKWGSTVPGGGGGGGGCGGEVASGSVGILKARSQLQDVATNKHSCLHLKLLVLQAERDRCREKLVMHAYAGTGASSRSEIRNSTSEIRNRQNPAASWLLRRIFVVITFCHAKHFK